jgi:hypothetical protein
MKCSTISRSGGLFGALVLASLLAGCNVVVSDRPWFTATGATGAPKLREGVWLGSSSFSTPCAVDERRPIEAWPDCARPTLVQKFGLIGLSKDSGRWQRTSYRYVLAGRQPLILQVGTSQKGKPGYVYDWVRVTGLDDQGRVIAFSAGPVFCGGSAATSGTSTSLYPGLVKRDTDCTASSVGALRDAAKASDAYATPTGGGHWVRDGAR